MLLPLSRAVLNGSRRAFIENHIINKPIRRKMGSIMPQKDPLRPAKRVAEQRKDVW